MTTLTVKLDDAVVAKVRALAESRHASVDDVVAQALKDLETEKDPAADFVALMDEFGAKGVGPLPELSREERNARR